MAVCSLDKGSSVLLYNFGCFHMLDKGTCQLGLDCIVRFLL